MTNPLARTKLAAALSTMSDRSDWVLDHWSTIHAALDALLYPKATDKMVQRAGDIPHCRSAYVDMILELTKETP